jgi:hypothetical protein
VPDLSLALAGLLVVGYAAGAMVVVRNRRRRPPPAAVSPERRATWRMPPLNLLERPSWSRGRMAGMYALRGYLVVAVVMLGVKAVQLGLH